MSTPFRFSSKVSHYSNKNYYDHTQSLESILGICGSSAAVGVAMVQPK